jgi:hypothetical protein
MGFVATMTLKYTLKPNGDKMDIFGYFIEYYRDNRYVGKIITQVKDREEFGYAGKINQTASKDIHFKNKKIKRGEQFMTMLYPLNGR